MDKVIVIGGGAGGMTSATQIKRKDPSKKVMVFDKGNYVSWAGCPTPYYIAGKLPEKSVIHYTPEYFRENRKIDVFVRHEVKEISFKEKRVYVEGENLNGWVDYDYLVLAPGGKPFIPPMNGIEKDGVFKLSHVEDAFSIKEYLNKENPKNAVIVGGGAIGLEMAETFSDLGIKVTIIEKLPVILPFLKDKQRDYILDTLKSHGVRLITDDTVLDILGEEKVKGVKTEKGENIDADILLVSIGVRPNTEFLKDSGFELSERGAIDVDEHMRTYIENVYAAGDSVLVKHMLTGKKVLAPLGDVADKEGLVVGANIAGFDMVFPGIVGTAITKVFEWEVARTGLTLDEAKKAGYENAKEIIVKGYHKNPGFGVRGTTFNVVFDDEKGLFLGAFAVGEACVAQFIDTFATFISLKIPIDEAFSVDYAYCPATSTVWNPLLAAYRKITKN